LYFRSSLGRQETFRIKTTDTNDYHGNDEKKNLSVSTGSNGNTSHHGLASKPSFADMTVEEICEEIRRIKTKEVRVLENN